MGQAELCTDARSLQGTVSIFEMKSQLFLYVCTEVHIFRREMAMYLGSPAGDLYMDFGRWR